MRHMNRFSPVLSILSVGSALLILATTYSPSVAQTAAPTAAPTASAPTFKQIGQIGKGSVESIGWITGSNHVEIRVGDQVQYFDSKLTHLGTLDLKDRTITAISHSDTYTALGFEEGTVQLYTIADQKLYATLTGHTARINAIAFSADHNSLITGSNDGTARVWDVASHSLLQTLTNSTLAVTSVGFASDKSDDPTRAYTYNAANRTWHTWDTKTGITEVNVQVPNSTWLVNVIDPTLHYVITNVQNSTNHDLLLTDVLTNTRTTIATGFSQPPTGALFSLDGRKLYIDSVYSGEATVMDTATRQVIKSITLPPDKIRFYEFSSDGIQLAIGTTDGFVILENLTTGRESRFKTSVTPIKEVRFSHAGDRLFIWDTTGKIAVWDTDGHSVGNLDNGADVLVFSYESKSPVILTTNSAGNLTTWDATTLTKLGTVPGFSTFTYPIIWSPDGKQLAGVKADNIIHIWDARTDKEIRQLKGHGLAVNAIAWSPDGKLIASASSDQTVRIWDAITGQALHTIPFADRNYAVAFSPDSKLLAVGSRQTGKQLTFFTTDGKQVSVVSNLSQTVDSIVWHPNDPAHLLGAEPNGMLVTVDLTDMNIVQATEVKNSSTAITGVAWSPDGSTAIVTSGDHILRFWSFSDTLTLKSTIHTVSLTLDVSWNKTGDLIAMTDGNLIQLIDPTGTQIGTISGHTSTVYSAEWSPDGTRLASSSNDGTIRIWQRQ